MASYKQTFVAVAMIFVWGLGAPSALTVLSGPSALQEDLAQQWKSKTTPMLPVLKPGLSAQEKADAVTQIEIGMRHMKTEIQGDKNVPPEVNEGIRAWESMSRADHVRLLSPSTRRVGVAPVVMAVTATVVAAVAVARFIYDVGKDYSWWGKKGAAFELRQPTDKELDYLKKSEKTPTSQGPVTRFDEHALDF